VTRERKARIITILVLVVALGIVVSRKTDLRTYIPGLSAAAAATATPQDAIYAMLDAARAGDTAKYLSSYTGEMAQSLKRARDESPDFPKYLRESNAGLKGIAVMEPQAQSDREVKARVEYVYQDRNEVQFFYLEKAPGGWKISRVESAERSKTLIPYGTPVE
jgi:hypothetical protein